MGTSLLYVYVFFSFLISGNKRTGALGRAEWRGNGRVADAEISHAVFRVYKSSRFANCLVRTMADLVFGGWGDRKTIRSSIAVGN